MAGQQDNGNSGQPVAPPVGSVPAPNGPSRPGHGSRAHPDDGPPTGQRALPTPQQAQATHSEARDRSRPTRGDRPDSDKDKKGDGDQDDSQQQDEKKDQKDGQEGADKKKNQDDGDDKDKQPGKKPFWKRPVLLSVMIGVVVILTVAGIILWLVMRNYEETDDAYIDGHIVHVAPRVPGRVLSLNVNDNQLVEAGTVVIEIDPADFMVAHDRAVAAQQQAEARLQQAQANELVAEANAAQAHADVTVAQANATNAEEDFRRILRLQPEARTQQQVDQITANQQSSAATVLAQQKKAASMDAQTQAAKTAITAAQADIASAKANVEQADLNLRYCSVTAGQAGFVTRRTVEAGDYVQVGQELLDIVPRDVWVTANYKETQLTNMKPNQTVSISVDAFPGHDYRGHVNSIQTGSGAVFSVLPPENATGNFVKIVQRVPVKILFDETLDHILAPGMSVETTVKTGHGQ
jgi:membrane fusion protein (multidrug efflux system)